MGQFLTSEISHLLLDFPSQLLVTIGEKYFTSEKPRLARFAPAWLLLFFLASQRVNWTSYI